MRELFGTEGATTQTERSGDNVQEVADIVVGKDILELLSSSMYVNPLSVFREYTQNAVDAIDEAVAGGLLSSVDVGVIEISLDQIDRRVVIRDNGRGLGNAEFLGRMLAFGASEKRGTDARGFRGVGRLAALGYVQQLVFRSRAEGDTQIMEARWDGRVVKRMLASADVNTDLRTIVKEAVSFRRLAPDGFPGRFFEVELAVPRRIANDILLNEIEIERFISQVCPCPFSPGFAFREEIQEILAPYGRAGDCYNIHINGAQTPVYRPYRDVVSYSNTKKASVRNLKSFEIESMEGDVAGIGWFVHHGYQGAIPASEGVRGLRARVGNMQVGQDRLFQGVFPEERFCSWAIGEVHVLDSRVVPNGRRDEFEDNVHLDNIVAHLRPIGTEVARECRVSSQKRNRLRTFELGADKVDEKLAVLMQGAVSQQYAGGIRGEIGSLLAEMREVAQFELFRDEDRCTLRSQLRKIEEEVGVYATKAEEEVLDNVPMQRRASYREIFDLIYDCSANQVAARKLVDRMVDRLSRS